MGYVRSIRSIRAAPGNQQRKRRDYHEQSETYPLWR